MPAFEDTLHLCQAISNWQKKRDYTQVRSTHFLVYDLSLRQSSTLQHLNQRLEELEQSVLLQQKGMSQGPLFLFIHDVRPV
jgi:hypothetical protein